jgi:hypothetical protein
VEEIEQVVESIEEQLPVPEEQDDAVIASVAEHLKEDSITDSQADAFLDRLPEIPETCEIDIQTECVKPTQVDFESMYAF